MDELTSQEPDEINHRVKAIQLLIPVILKSI